MAGTEYQRAGEVHTNKGPLKFRNHFSGNFWCASNPLTRFASHCCLEMQYACQAFMFPVFPATTP